MAQKYAKGSRAWGICGRSGRKMLLKDMVFDGRYPNMRVDPAWYEDKHPQEYMPKVEDPTALWRPSPEVIAPPSAPVLTTSIQGNDILVTWTPAETGITEIASYSIFLGVDGVTPTLLITCNVVRDFLGGITAVQHCTTVPSVPADDTSDQPQPGDNSGSVFDKVTNEDAPVSYLHTGLTAGHTYCHYVVANPMGNNQSVAQGPPSAPSSTQCLFLPGQATTPVLAGVLVASDVDLSWSAATVPGSTIANYELFRNIDGGAFSPLTTVAGNVLAYVDLAPPPGHTYGYTVQALPTLGLNSAMSNEVDIPISGGAHTWSNVYIEPGAFTGNAISDFVFFSASRILAVGDLGTLVLSTDGGATWNPVTPAVGGNSFLGRSELAYNGSVVVITTTNLSGFNVVSRSIDQGATWTLVSPPGMALVDQVVWSPLLNLFCAPDGASALMWTSPDGLTWTSRALSGIFNPNPASPYKDRTEQFGLFIRVGGGAGHTGQILTTADGVTWNLITIANPTFGFLTTSFDGTYVLADGVSAGHQWLYRTTDGVTWNLASTSASPTVPPFSPVVLTFNGLLVTGFPADGSIGLGTSADHGSTFSSIGVTTAMDGPWDAWAIGATFFHAFAGSLSGIASSTDLSSWSDELDDGTVGIIITIKSAFGITLAGGSQNGTQTAAIWKRS